MTDMFVVVVTRIIQTKPGTEQVLFVRHARARISILGLAERSVRVRISVLVLVFDVFVRMVTTV